MKSGVFAVNLETITRKINGHFTETERERGPICVICGIMAIP